MRKRAEQYSDTRSDTYTGSKHTHNGAYKCTYKPCYQDSCGRSGLKEYNVWGGFSEFPEEIGFQSKYDYTRLSEN